jgi:hypothetical protein
MNSKNNVADLEPLRDLVTRLTVSSNALAALALFINQKIAGTQADASIQPYLDEVIDTLGMRSILENAHPSQLIWLHFKCKRQLRQLNKSQVGHIQSKRF